MRAATDPGGNQPLIIEILTGRGMLDPKKLESLRDTRTKDDDLIERQIIRLGYATDREIASAYAEHLGLTLFEPRPETEEIDRSLARLLPEKLCRDQLISPVAVHGDRLDVVFATPNEMLIVDEAQLPLTGQVTGDQTGCLGGRSRTWPRTCWPSRTPTG